MKDFLGRELAVGDWVVIVDSSNSSAYFKGPFQVTELKVTPRTAFVHFNGGWMTKKSPSKVLKVSEEDVTFYLLQKSK